MDQHSLCCKSECKEGRKHSYPGITHLFISAMGHSQRMTSSGLQTSTMTREKREFTVETQNTVSSADHSDVNAPCSWTNLVRFPSDSRCLTFLSLEHWFLKNLELQTLSLLLWDLLSLSPGLYPRYVFTKAWPFLWTVLIKKDRAPPPASVGGQESNFHGQLLTSTDGGFTMASLFPKSSSTFLLTHPRA